MKKVLWALIVALVLNPLAFAQKSNEEVLRELVAEKKEQIEIERRQARELYENLDKLMKQQKSADHKTAIGLLMILGSAMVLPGTELVEELVRPKTKKMKMLFTISAVVSLASVGFGAALVMNNAGRAEKLSRKISIAQQAVTDYEKELEKELYEIQTIEAQLSRHERGLRE